VTLDKPVVTKRTVVRLFVGKIGIMEQTATDIKLHNANSYLINVRYCQI